MIRHKSSELKVTVVSWWFALTNWWRGPWDLHALAVDHLRQVQVKEEKRLSHSLLCNFRWPLTVSWWLALQNQIDGEKLLLFVGLALSTLALALSICLANKKTHILLEFCLWLNSQVAGSKEVDYGCSQVDGNWGCTGAQIFAPACNWSMWGAFSV